MREKSHKGQRHKGCGLCDWDKRTGNGKDRRPADEHAWRQRAQKEIDAVVVK